LWLLENNTIESDLTKPDDKVYERDVLESKGSNEMPLKCSLECDGKTLKRHGRATKPTTATLPPVQASRG
jgi:hypothetical protein